MPHRRRIFPKLEGVDLSPFLFDFPVFHLEYYKAPWLIHLCSGFVNCTIRLNQFQFLCTRSNIVVPKKKIGGVFRERNVLLVIAHPDDESMFFTPTLNYLSSRGCNLHILCMSTGNADGMGNIRKEELYLASIVLKVPQKQVKVLDHPDLQDGFGKSWNSKLLSKIIKEEIANSAIDLVVTFDNYGVSGHCNHQDVHQGVQKLLQDTSHKEVEAWELVSTSILRKYSGPVDIWLSLLSAKFHSSEGLRFFLNEHPRRSLAAMAEHKSQWVWFRKLFVSFSSYTYVNCLKKIS